MIPIYPEPAGGEEPRRRPALRGVLAASLALLMAYALALGLRRHEAAFSHQQPTPEAWFVAPAPTSVLLLKSGRALFLSSCAHCHGADATGDEGPDLHGLEASDRYVAMTITRGIKGEMPSFRKKLAAPDIAKLTAYLRSLPADP
jgi:mono/diheme cytochrome c family protein